MQTGSHTKMTADVYFVPLPAANLRHELECHFMTKKKSHLSVRSFLGSRGETGGLRPFPLWRARNEFLRASSLHDLATLRLRL